jgi:methionyl-tRNA formyltransferase
MNPKESVRLSEQAKKLPPPESPPGSIYYDRSTSTLLVKCADDWIRLLTVKVEGKREQKMQDFANGYQLPQRDLDTLPYIPENTFK